MKNEFFSLLDKITITVLNPLRKLIKEVFTVNQRLDNLEKSLANNGGNVETEMGTTKLRIEKLERIIDDMMIPQSTIKMCVLSCQNESQKEEFGTTEVETDLTAKLQDSE